MGVVSVSWYHWPLGMCENEMYRRDLWSMDAAFLYRLRITLVACEMSTQSSTALGRMIAMRLRVSLSSRGQLLSRSELHFQSEGIVR